MIEADKRALKATLTHGISTILGELVGLYSSNLGDLGDVKPPFQIILISSQVFKPRSLLDYHLPGV
jgi:hypothetical protein